MALFSSQTTDRVAGMILPLSFEVYKPRERLKDRDEYHSKPQIAATMIRQLQAMGLRLRYWYPRQAP